VGEGDRYERASGDMSLSGLQLRFKSTYVLLLLLLRPPLLLFMDMGSPRLEKDKGPQGGPGEGDGLLIPGMGPSRFLVN